MWCRIERSNVIHQGVRERDWRRAGTGLYSLADMATAKEVSGASDAGLFCVHRGDVFRRRGRWRGGEERRGSEMAKCLEVVWVLRNGVANAGRSPANILVGCTASFGGQQKGRNVQEA